MDLLILREAERESMEIFYAMREDPSVLPETHSAVGDYFV